MPLQFPSLDFPDSNDAALQTFLQCCSQGDLTKVLESLEGRNPTDVSHARGLEKATSGNHIPVMRYLLETGAIITELTVYKAKSREAYQALLDHGLEVNNPMPFASVPLISAAGICHCHIHPCIKYQLPDLRARHVVARNDESLLRWFLSLGADPNRGPPDTRDKGFVGGRDPPVPNSGGALETAARFFDTVIVDILIEHGAKIENSFAFQYAMFRDGGYRRTMMEHLLRRGFDVNRFGFIPSLPYGGAALHVAVNLNLPEEVRWLVDHGADPSYGGDVNVTPGHYAVLRKNRAMLEMLRNEDAVYRARKDALEVRD